jgi:hypothetical protein
MSISANRVSADITGVNVSDEALTLTLADGRMVSAPLVWFPRLLRASAEQRRNWRLVAGGVGVHWPDLDEDISARSLLAIP